MLHHHLTPSLVSGHITKDGTSSACYFSVFNPNSSCLSQSVRSQAFWHHLLWNEEEHVEVWTLLHDLKTSNCHYIESLFIGKQQRAYTKCSWSCFKNVSSFHTNRSWSSSMQVPVYECVQSQDGTGKYIIMSCSTKFSGFLVISYAIIVGSFKVMGNDCRINWIVFYNSRKAKLVSLHPGRDSSETLLHKLTNLTLKLHLNRTINIVSPLSSLCLWSIFVPLYVTSYHQLVMFTL